MARRPGLADGGGVLVAGAIELDGDEVLLVLVVIFLFLLYLLALCLTGGLVAGGIARKRQAFVVGSVVFGAAASWMYWRVGHYVDRALLVGWLAAALSGFALRAADESNVGLTPVRARPAAVVILVAAGALIASTVANERRTSPEPSAEALTREQALMIGQELGASEVHTAKDLALLADQSGGTVMWAEGDLEADGVDLVIRLRSTPWDQDDGRLQCWSYRLPRRLATPQPEPVVCPDVVAVDDVSSGFDAELGGALGELDVTEKEDAAAVREAATTVIDAWFGPDPGWPGAALEGGMTADVPTELVVERLPHGPFAVAVRVGLVDCVVARLDLVDETGWVTQTWRPDWTQLLSYGPGCSPELAAAGPPLPPS
jgi:hypothetical protein